MKTDNIKNSLQSRIINGANISVRLSSYKFNKMNNNNIFVLITNSRNSYIDFETAEDVLYKQGFKVVESSEKEAKATEKKTALLVVR